MLREVLPFVDLIEDDSPWQHKASILKAIAELLEKQGRHEEALRAKQDLADLLQEHVHEVVESSDEESSGEESTCSEESSMIASDEESGCEDASGKVGGERGRFATIRLNRN